MRSIILGTRHEIIKMSPVVQACEGSGLDYFMVHTGQARSCGVDPGVLRAARAAGCEV